jgi:hypothetical protein
LHLSREVKEEEEEEEKGKEIEMATFVSRFANTRHIPQIALMIK